MPGIRHLMLRVEGLIGTSQTWSVNPKFSFPSSGVPTQTSLDAWTQWVEQTYGPSILPMAKYCSTLVSVTGVTASYVDETGKSVVISKRAFVSPIQGTGTAAMPPQNAVVVTLQTNVPGRRARGRIYMPYLAGILNSTTGRLGLTPQQDIAAAFGTWLQDLADGYGTATPILPVVSSSVGATNTPVTSVRVGDVIDTQRRRRDQFLENYVVAPVQ